MNGELKGIINTIYKVCDSLDGSYDLDGLSMRELMRMDLLKFILYLGAADEEITEEEAEFIAEYLGWEMTIPQWCDFINKQNLHSDSILDDTPFVFKVFVDADNKAYSYDKTIMNACENYIWVFETLGENFIESDYSVDRNEQVALGKYIGMLRQYYEENTKRANSVNTKKVNSKKVEEKDENIRIELENRTIVIPKALPETIKRMQELVSLRDEMIRQSERERDRYDPDDSFATARCCYVKMCEVILKYGDKYEEEFKRKYDSGAFSSFSTYLDKYAVVCKSAADRITDAYKYQVAMREYGQSIAKSEAYKEIKGMPFGIITNSISSVLLYNGMAAINHASQVKKAEQTYNRIMAKYGDSGAAYKEMQIMTSEVFPLIYPVSEKSTADFLDDVMKRIERHENNGYSHMTDEHKTCKLTSDDNYVYGDTIALRKAMNALQSIGDGLDDYEKVIDILEHCPYCPEVYLKLIKIGKFDKKVFEIAKKMYLDKMILPELEKEVTKRKDNVADIKPILEIIAVYKSQSFEQVLKSTYQSTINRIKNDYHELFLLCADSKSLDKWIMEKINSDMDKVVTTSEDDARNKVNSWIQRNVEDTEFAELSNMGLMTIEDVRMKDSTMATLEDVKTEYANTMVSRIMDYIKEAKVRKVAYEEAYDKFNAELKKKSDALDSKMAELKQQGMFAFSKKKEIKAEIEHLQRDLEDFRKTEPVKLREAYYGMYA